MVESTRQETITMPQQQHQTVPNDESAIQRLQEAQKRNEERFMAIDTKLSSMDEMLRSMFEILKQREGKSKEPDVEEEEKLDFPNSWSRGMNDDDTLETLHGAATVMASVDNHLPQSRSAQKRRWGHFWNLYWCFGSNKHNKRIGHAVLVPEPLGSASTTEVPGSENPIQGPMRVLPCAAPPSSPASFFQSEPPSSTQTPTGSLSVAANMDSPSGPRSIFAIGPYANETQLVSPPVFSTEPSTAPFTPPPESVQLTTPSSPEVPFAQLLDPNYQNREGGTRFPQAHYEFQTYQLYPGSPVGQLISPSSCISESGTSSPFPDYLEFRPGAPPRLFNLDKLANDDWGSRLGSGSLTPKSRDSSILERQNSQILYQQESEKVDPEIAADHRVSFELKPEIRCIEQRMGSLTRAVVASLQNQQTLKSAETSSEVDFHEYHFGATNDTGPSEWEEGQQRPEKHRSMTLGSIKEFNFDNVEANDKVEDQPNQNWSFFPMLQPGVT